MVTRKQKQELIDTLKFTPIKARVLIQGYGGESYIGSVDRQTYEFFKSKQIDVEQYVNDWDDLFSDVPAEHRFVEPGSPYECDNLFHQSGATMDDGSYITIEDENGTTLFESNLNLTTLSNTGVTISCNDECDSDEMEEGTVIFWGGQGEKGCFFDGEITLRAPFDPTKLTVYYGNGDGWCLSGSVEYDGEEIEGYDGYSTTGKWAEHKFHIVGDEEVYQGVEREEGEESDDDEEDDWDPAAELEKIQVPVLEGEEEWAQKAIDDSIKTEWFDKAVKPYHKGEYEVMIDAPWPMGGPGMAEWTGRTWKQSGKKVAIHQWRGLTENLN